MLDNKVAVVAKEKRKIKLKALVSGLSYKIMA